MIVLTGDNEYLIKKRLYEIVSKFETENGDFSVERIDSRKIDFDSFISNIQSVSLLSPKRMFVLYQPGKYEEWSTGFSDLTSSIPSSTTVIILEPRIDKRLKYFKDLKAIKQFESFDILAGSKLAAWIVDYVKIQNASIDYSDANHLISSLGSDQNRLANELDKLIAFNSNITKQNIDLLVEPSLNSTVFQLLDMAFNGLHKKVFNIFNQLMFDKTEIPQIIGAIAWQLQLFAVIKSLPGYSAVQISERSGMNAYAIENSMRMIEDFSYSDIAKFSQKLVDLSIEMKDYQIDQNEALLNLLNGFYK
jgi:DNA polymerase III delta subunit